MPYVEVYEKVLNISLRQEKGRALIETLSVVLLLVLLGACCLSLSLSTFKTYQRLNDSRDKTSELRIASSFLTSKIRQNDIAGSIEVKPEPITGNNALVIYENINGESYATWIYHNSGCLMESLVLSHETPTPDISQIMQKLIASR